MGLFGGPPREREELDDGDKAWTREWDRGNRTEKEVIPDHGPSYTETTYRNGTTYCEGKDGPVEKTSGK